MKLIKMHSESPNIIYVFRDDYCRGGRFNPLELNDKFFGLYNKEKDIFYFEDSYEENKAQIDKSGLNYTNLQELKSEIENEVNGVIIKKIKSDEESLNKFLEESSNKSNVDSVKRYAERLIITNQYEDKLDSCEYAKFKHPESVKYDFDLYIDYIENQLEFIEYKSNCYIEENKERIYRDILFNNDVRIVVENLKNDIELLLIRKIRELCNNENYKTLNILYRKNDKEMRFKIENNCASLEKRDSYISGYNIKSPHERKAFENTFKSDRHFTGEIEPKYIEEITYGKKVLYKK